MKNTLLAVSFFLVTFALQAQKPEITYATPLVIGADTAMVPLTPVNTGGALSPDGIFVTTFVGSTTSGFVNDTGSAARFYYPTGLAVDKSGNTFVTDKYNHVIRKITPAGVVSTFAGSGSIGSADGQGAAASFYYPAALVIDPNGNLFVSDQYNQKIRKITKDGLVSTFAGNGIEGFVNGPALEALFYRPEGIAMDSSGNFFIADVYNHSIRKITPSGTVSTLAGNGGPGSTNGTGSSASFNYPCALAIDAFGNVFVADQWNNKIRKVTPSGIVTTFAGTGAIGSTDGPDSIASFNYPSGLFFDHSGNLLVADRNNNLLRKITPDGKVSTLAGNLTAGSADGTFATARFNYPFAMAFDLSGNLILADRYNHEIRKIVLSIYEISPALPKGMSIDPHTGVISGIPEVGSAPVTYQVTARNASGMDTAFVSISIHGKPFVYTHNVTSTTKTTAVANGTIEYLGFPKMTSYGVCWNKTGNPTMIDSFLTRDSSLVVQNVSFPLSNLSPNTKYYLRTFATNSIGTYYGNVVTFYTNGEKPKISYSIPATISAGVEITPIAPVNTGGLPTSNGYMVSTFAGNGTASSGDGIGVEAGFNYPMGVAVDSAGYVYAVDRQNNRICKISPAGKVVTLAGSGQIGNTDGKGKNASFNLPYGIDLDVAGNAYVVDRYNNTIRKITPDGVVTTFAGSGAIGSTDGVGTAASFNWPTGVALDNGGNLIIADTYNNKIRKITPAGLVTTIAGNGSIGTTDGAALSASFNVPTGVEVDGSGNIWVADVNNNMIRKISTDGIVSTIAGNGERSFADGTGRAAGFFFPYSLIMDPDGNFLVGDANNNRIRKVTKDGVVTTLAGNGNEASVDGLPGASSFNYPADVAYDAAGNIYVADAENHKIRKIAPKCYTITPTLPNGLTFDNLTGVINGKALKGSPSTVYNIVASNSSGNDSVNITLTIQDTPVLKTLPVTSTLMSSAVGNGNFINLGFPYPTSYGVCWSKSGIPTIDSLKVDNGTTAIGGLFTAKIVNLTPRTRYIVRAYAVSSLGTAYGDTLSFITAAPAPEISYPVNDKIFKIGTSISPISLTNIGGDVLPYTEVSTLAGNGTYGSVDSTLLLSSFYRPYSVATSKSGDIYVADSYNNKIRRITLDGKVKTLAGTGSSGSLDGPGASATFNYPSGLTVDKNGNVYVADSYNNKIRKITKDGNVVTVAGGIYSGSTNGIGVNSTFSDPTGIVVDTVGNLFVADYANNLIRKIDTTGLVTTFAGSNWGSADGTGSTASFSGPTSITIDASGTLFVVESDGNKVRKITSAGVVTTLAGNSNTGSADGFGTSATFYNPSGIAVDSKGNVWIADRRNNKIRKITPSGLVSTVGGTNTSGSKDGNSTLATFYNPCGIAIDSRDVVYIADLYNNKIRRMASGNYYLSSALPAGLNLDLLSGTISGTPTVGSAMAVYKVIGSNLGGLDTATVTIAVEGKPTIQTLIAQASSGNSAIAQGRSVNPGYPMATAGGFCWNKTGAPVVTDSSLVVQKYSEMAIFTSSLTNLTPGTTYYLRTFATNSIGTSYGEEFIFTTPELAPNIQYVSPQVYSVNTEINPLIPINAGGIPKSFLNVSTLAGNNTNASVDGSLSIASFSNPSSVAVDAQGTIYVADANSNKIRKISTEGQVSTFAGSGLAGFADGTGNAASFYSPRGIAVDAKGNVFVADTYNNRIRKISKDGVVTTLAGSGLVGNTLGTGTAASFYNPAGLAVDTSGNVYVADKRNNRICMINPVGVVTTIAGSGIAGSIDGKGLNATFYQPSGVAVDARGTIYVADYSNHKIRKITPDTVVSTLAGNSYSGQTDGTGSNASFYYPIGLTVDSIGNLYVAEYGYGKIRKVTSAGVVTSFAGQTYNTGYLDGKSAVALFSYPSGITLDNTGALLVADYGNNRIRKIAPAFYSISPSLPDGLKLDVMTGLISGKPTTSNALKTYYVYTFNTGGENNAEVTLSITPMGINDMESDRLSIYPNPANVQIQLKGLNGREMMTIYTLTGVKLLSQEVTNGEFVNISKLKSGLYMVKVGGKDLKLMKK